MKMPTDHEMEFPRACPERSRRISILGARESTTRPPFASSSSAAPGTRALSGLLNPSCQAFSCQAFSLPRPNPLIFHSLRPDPISREVCRLFPPNR
jgi:hypothetical protein